MMGGDEVMAGHHLRTAKMSVLDGRAVPLDVAARALGKWADPVGQALWASSRGSKCQKSA